MGPQNGQYLRGRVLGWVVTDGIRAGPSLGVPARTLGPVRGVDCEVPHRAGRRMKHAL